MPLGVLTTKMKEIAMVKIQQHTAFIIPTNNNSCHVSKAKVARLQFLRLQE